MFPCLDVCDFKYNFHWIIWLANIYLQYDYICLSNHSQSIASQSILDHRRNMIAEALMVGLLHNLMTDSE